MGTFKGRTEALPTHTLIFNPYISGRPSAESTSEVINFLGLCHFAIIPWLVWLYGNCRSSCWQCITTTWAVKTIGTSRTYKKLNMALFVRLHNNYTLLYRHECFTGKYTTCNLIHKNYIRDPSGLFSINSRVMT